jgi:hypothetical protein
LNGDVEGLRDHEGEEDVLSEEAEEPLTAVSGAEVEEAGPGLRVGDVEDGEEEAEEEVEDEDDDDEAVESLLIATELELSGVPVEHHLRLGPAVDHEPVHVGGVDEATPSKEELLIP